MDRRGTMVGNGGVRERGHGSLLGQRRGHGHLLGVQQTVRMGIAPS